MTKEKKNKPSKELPLGFVYRQEKELLVRDFIISNIKEVMIKYGFQYLETPSFEYSDSIGKFLPDKEIFRKLALSFECGVSSESYKKFLEDKLRLVLNAVDTKNINAIKGQGN